MPKETFFRLSPEKRKKIIDAFLREFAIKSYDEASITSVVKQLRIAKGSIYQYFENKLDLFLFLATESGVVKKKYIESVKRENYPDFWAYMKALYTAGLEFDKMSPLESHFLHSIYKNINSPSIKELYDTWLQQTVSAFVFMVQHEVDLGLFRNDLAVEKMGFILYKSLLSINDYMIFFHDLKIEQSIEKNVPVYSQGKDIKLMEAVEEHFLLLRKTFEKNSYDKS